ncbi:MAG: class I SAM-dependent methyltransferase [Candidatus Paceibacterota bacterium]
MLHSILTTKPSKDYELLDSGREEKLERYGNIVLARPDPQALWEKRLGDEEWKRADAWYERKAKGGDWHTSKDFAKEWHIELGELNFIIRPTSFKHTGLFPEQVPNWQWISENLNAKRYPLNTPKVLNLFAYTGGATLAAAKAGAQVTHVDASKTAIEWAKANAKLSGLNEKPIRWVTEDVMKFVEREAKRKNTYDAIIMDPPAFGHGPKDELWKIEEDFLTLMKLCKALLSDKPLFILVSGYAAGYSSLAFAHNLESVIEKNGGGVEAGELTIEESARSIGSIDSRQVSGEQDSGRLLPAGIFARWSN